jgi:polar amino acid transport system substrate-binding protein
MLSTGTTNAEDFRAQLIPNGCLRLGIVAAPAPSALFAVFDTGSQTYRGVTVELGEALAMRLDADLVLVNFPNSGACTEALEAGAIDVCFMPVDAERQKRMSFGPAYYIIESTYLVTGSSGIKTLAEVDRKGVRAVGITNTTTIRSSTRSLVNTVPEAVETIAEAVSRLTEGKAEALALSRDAFRTLLPHIPGAVVLDGGFQQTGIAIAVGRQKPAALAFVSDFLGEAKRNGIVRRAMDAAGLEAEPIAPDGAPSGIELLLKL